MWLQPTVKQLLQHRAGIYCPEFPQLFGWVEQQLEDFADPNARLAATVDLLAREPLVHEPGADFVYGIQYDVLGRLLEVVGGMPLDQLFQEKIFGPLCMERTTFGLEPELQPAVAAVFQPGQGGLTDATEQNTRPGVATCHPLGYFCAGEGLQGELLSLHCYYTVVSIISPPYSIFPFNFQVRWRTSIGLPGR